jgi:flavorubredoxin
VTFALKLWPQKRWKKILLISVIVIVVVLASLLAYVIYAINTDIATELVVKNPDGSKTALVLYHPGLSSFAHDVSYAFADGLASNGWRVEIATPSTQASTDTSKYNLLVLVASTYGGQPDSPTMRHLERMGDLHGINTVIVALAGGVGGAESTTKALQEAVSSANGTIIKLLALYNQAPNEGNKSATELAEQAGSEITR